MVRAILVVVLLAGVVLLSCRTEAAPTKVAVSLADWSVSPGPEEIKQGKASFEVKNNGTRQHQFVVVKSDLPATQLPLRDERVDEDKVHVVGKTNALAAGETTVLTVSVSAGKYVLLCNLLERPGGVPLGHYNQGMATSFLVLP